ncbi:sensor histidine kinase [Kineococcus glutinatus]|uniref:histidine kinase n=1 Tax=Kineococcus glutinatus TaxID=1070872 RepID=A0ABP9I0Y5_9ACTN
MVDVLAPIGSPGLKPVDGPAAVDRLRLTAVALGSALAAAPALALGILTVLSIPLALVTAGFVLALGVVPATEALTRLHRRVSGDLLGQRLVPAYADTTGTTVVTRPVRWLRDPARWRDFALCWFSATGGLAMSLVPPVLLAAPVTHLVGALVDGGVWWWSLVLLGGPLLLVWWVVTPPLVRARALAERGILGGEVAALHRRVEEVTSSRAQVLDSSAAEVRRIERDLHDGAQARIAAVGMHVGLAEKLVATDPDAAVALLREARETTVAALEDLRSVVRGIHPPVLADRGLAGAVEALALTLPLPVTLSLDLPGRGGLPGGAAGGLPAPVESAVYFAVAECLANTAKHAGATRAWVSGSSRQGPLRVVVGDDGCGGADPAGSGLAGIARRLAAFDGTLAVDSPAGGPTVVTVEVPWRPGR